MSSNLPSLFSLELVGSSKNVAKSTSWPQVQKAVYLWGIVRKTVKAGSYQNRGDFTGTTHEKYFDLVEIAPVCLFYKLTGSFVSAGSAACLPKASSWN